MKSIILIFTFVCGIASSAQTKAELIESSVKDSVITYAGEGDLGKGNCLLIKFTADAQLFFNELASLHAKTEEQVKRTKNTLAINPTTTPYWVYGEYSVFATIQAKEDYQLITVYFKAYSNPENYKMYGAARTYQELLNKILASK